jgi:phosphoglycolate phosphatase-like HAD superfamily hydrolase
MFSLNEVQTAPTTFYAWLHKIDFKVVKILQLHFFIRFDAIVSADAFENLKPSPDIFLAASRILNVPPSEVYDIMFLDQACD